MKSDKAILIAAMLLISLFVSAVPIAIADEGDTHNIIDEVGTGFTVLIGQKLNFTGDVPAGVPIIGVLPEDIEGDVFGVTSNNYDTEAFMSTGGIYWIDVDYDGIGGNPAGYDWQDDDDTYLYVCDPHLHLNLKVQGKSVESIQQGTNLIIDFDTNLADTDTVDLKITDPNGTMLTVNPTNANQTFDDINISYLRSHYNNPNGITTDGWQLGNYTFQIITEPNMARGLDACSSIRMLEICKPGITIEADKTSVPPFEYVRLTVKGAQSHKITVNSSNPEHTIFPVGIENNPFSPSIPFNDTIDADGKRSYIVYFNSSGMYKISVRDIDTDLHNSTNISVVIEGINITDRGAIIVTGKPNHTVNIITSCPSETDFELGKYDYTTTTQNLEGFIEGIWENGIIDTIDEDGIRKYNVHFSGVGCYKMTVYDIDDTTEDSVISGCNGCRYWYKRHEENPERKQDAWTLSTVFIGESLNITGLDPFSYVIFEKTTEPFDQYFIIVDSDGCAIMESWDTLFIEEGGYNMSFVREGMSWEDREHKIVYFVEPKLVINITDTEGKRIESAREGQPIMIDVSGTALPEDDVLVRTIEGGGCWWSVGELNLSELRNYQIDTTCWMPGIYSINAETIEEKSRGLDIHSDWVDVEIFPRTNITPPTAIIDSITPNPAEQGKDTVSFTGYGIDSEGMVLAYNWRSSIDGQLSLSTSCSFTKPASELSIGTHTIYFKVLDNDGMWSIEDMENLTINSTNPTEVTTNSSSNVTTTSATLNGNLDDTGGESCQVWFEYGKTTSYGSSTSKQSKSSTGSFSANISELDDDTTYHFRAVASNGKGTVYGDDKSFNTEKETYLPQVTTNTVTGIGATYATLNGNLDDTGGESCQVWFEYGKTTSYGSSTSTQLKSSTGPFSAGISGLDNGTNYHFRAAASNSKGTVYGNDMTFTTKEHPSIRPLFTYTGDILPSADGWIILGYEAYESTGAHVEDGILHFTDFSSASGSAIHYRREWPVSPDYINVAEFDMKGVSCSELGGIIIGTSDNNYNMYYTIFPDRIQSEYRNLDSIERLGKVYYFDTTAQFNTYKAVIDQGIAKLYINGELVLEQPAGIGTWNPYGIHVVEFGAASSPATGEAYFDEVRAYVLEESFSTGSPADPYPSIMGTHNGTITPSCSINVNRLFTYSCEGTGGHTEYARIWNSTWNATATWKGYIGDWHNITFNKTVVLLANETYNYTIRTGSYPQIHHTSALPTANGWINCTEFVDANGKKYGDWIPAIKLW